MTPKQIGMIGRIARLFRDSYRAQGDDEKTARERSLKNFADALDRKAEPEIREFSDGPYMNASAIVHAGLANVGLFMPDERTSEAIHRAAEDALKQPTPNPPPRRKRGRRGNRR